MKRFKIAAACLCLFVFSATAAHADPISATIAAWTAFTTGAPWLVVGFHVARAAAGFSMLLQALSKKPKMQNAGIKTQTSTGGSTAQTFILGKRATSGQLVAPLDTYGVDGKTPNAFLTYVIALGCIPGQTLSRLVLNDEYVPVAGNLSTIGGSSVQGYALGGIYTGNAWLRYYNGTQTAADPLLDAKFNGVDRPWTSDMVGKGICYAVLVFRFNREVLNSPPSVRFELNGIPLYDPRRDTTVGGSGAHRWGNPATYAQTTNPAVMLYNLHRGIALPDGGVYGGEADAEDLPLDSWFAAMNACDAMVNLDGGGTEPRFAAGLEVSLADEPADVMEALETACQAQQVEIGGVWKINVGGPALPVAFFTDDDILIDRDRTHDMFPGLTETYNGIQASHPLPSALWEMTDAPPRFNADWEEADDDRRLVADLQLPAVFSPTQAQRLMKSAIEEERRFRRHSLSMGPYGAVLEPLDAIAWYSVSEGYGHIDAEGNKVGKIFEVAQVNEGLRTLNVEIGLRERDSADFSWDVSDELPWIAAIPGAALPVAQAVPSLAISASSVGDATGAARRPAIVIQWDGADMPDVRGIMWEVRVKATGVIAARGSLSDITSNGVVIAEGVLPLTTYEIRAQLVVDRPTSWSAWIEITTLDIRIDYDDLAGSLVTAIETPLDEILKTNLQLQAYQRIQDALNYTGDGRSLQFATLQAINKGQDAIDRVDLIGAMNGEETAFVLNTDFVKVPVPADVGEGTVDVPMAGFISTTHAGIEKAHSDILIQGQAIGGLVSRYTLKVQNVGDTGNTAVAGMVFEAEGQTGTIGFFANNFFLADKDYNPAHYNDPEHPNSPIKYPFVYTSGQLYLNTNVNIAGDLVVDGTIKTNKLEVNAVTNFWTQSFGPFDNVGWIDSTTHLAQEVARVTFNPRGGRVRISFRIAIASGTRCAARIKVYRGEQNISGSMLFIVEEAFTTTITTYIYDNTLPTVSHDYWITCQTVDGQHIGDTGGGSVNADVIDCNITLESFKR